MKHGGFTYIITNKNNKVLYTGVTAELRARVWEHISKFYPQSFTSKYNCDKLVWYEFANTIQEAIDREKQIKGGSRADKIALINSLNPTWKNLWEDIQDL